MSSSLGFLVRFVAASSAVFCLWEIFSKWYLHTVVPVTNSLFAFVQLPVQLEQRAGLLLYVYTRVDGSILRLQALDYDSVYLNLIAVASLFVATPGARLKWKLKWIGAVWVFLWATHVGQLLRRRSDRYLAVSDGCGRIRIDAGDGDGAFLSADAAAVDRAHPRIVEHLGALRLRARRVVSGLPAQDITSAAKARAVAVRGSASSQGRPARRGGSGSFPLGAHDLPQTPRSAAATRHTSIVFTAIAALSILFGSGCEQGNPFASDNVPPVADAGADASTSSGQPVVLDGSASDDAEGAEGLRFAWIQVSGPEAIGIQEAFAARAIVVPEIAGEYVFRLTVTDGDGISSVDEVRITVAFSETDSQPPPNASPTARATAELVVAVGFATILNGSASSDTDGDELVFAWSQTDGPATVEIDDADRDRAVFVPPVAGVYLFRLVVTDASGASSSADVRLTAAVALPDGGLEAPSPNQFPRADAGGPVTVEVGDMAQLDGTGSSDADGQVLSFAWIQVSGPTIVGIRDADAETAIVALATPGEYVFRLTVTDSQGASDKADVRLVVVDSFAETPDDGDTPGAEGDVGDGRDIGVPGDGGSPSTELGSIEIEALFESSEAGDRWLSLDGDGDVALIGPTSLLSFDPAVDAYTVELRLVTEVVAEGQVLTAIDAVGSDSEGTPFGIELRAGPDGTAAYGYTAADTRDEIRMGEIAPFVSAHVVLVVRRNFLLAYHNGVLVGVVERSGGSLPRMERTFVIGAGWAQGSLRRFFKGQIDRVRIWSRALSSGEIQESSGGLTSVDQQGLVAFWDFDEVDGDVVPDRSSSDLGARLRDGAHLAAPLMGP